MRVWSGSRESCSANVAKSSSGCPPLWQLPAPALNRVSPQKSEGVSVRERRHTWLIVCPGVSRDSSSTVRPIRITSPAPSPRSTPGTAAPAWARILAPVAATIASLPPMWSKCSWVLRTWVTWKPRSFAFARHFSWSRGSTARASPVSGQAMR